MSVKACTTCGEQLARLLQAYGVELVFGIPGVHTIELYRGLSQTRIRHITARHEQGAGFMADGYARVTGKPGVCFVVAGPGMTNVATAMGQAYADSIPMLVISTVAARRDLGMALGRLHELPSQRDLVAGVAAFSHTVMDAAQLPEIIARAFAIFASGRPRPVHIEIPLDVITANILDQNPTAWPMPSRPAASDDAVERAAALLNRARRPLLIVGGGGVDAAREIAALAERLDAPVFMTINAKGVLPPGHSLALIGNLAMEALSEEVRQSDVVLAIGTEFGETEMYPEPRPLQFGGTLIRIDIDPRQLMSSARSVLPIFADAKLATAAILAKARRASVEQTGSRRAAAIALQVSDRLCPRCATHRRLAKVVCDALKDVIVVGDQTEPVYAMNQFYQASRPRSFFNSSTGYATLGYGLPAALGAKLGAPLRPVVCLIGDGGLQFTLCELATAVDAGIGAAVIVWNNSSYGEIKDAMVNKGVAQIGVDLFSPDFVAAARAFGCAASAPANLTELTDALKASAQRVVPTLIEIVADSAFARSLAN